MMFIRCFDCVYDVYTMFQLRVYMVFMLCIMHMMFIYIYVYMVFICIMFLCIHMIFISIMYMPIYCICNMHDVYNKFK